MKKELLIIGILFLSYSTVLGRTVYNSDGQIIYDDTIRGKMRAAQEAKLERKYQAAAAAKINYDAAMRELEKDTGLKSNYYQDRNRYRN